MRRAGRAAEVDQIEAKVLATLPEHLAKLRVTVLAVTTYDSTRREMGDFQEPLPGDDRP